jgi:predicted nucleic acid-binding protein
MRIDAVVINASPLITLFRSGQADLLPRLFGHIVVPEAVWNEVTLDEWQDPAARELGAQTWPVRVNVEISPRVLPWNLGAGETAVLSHALSHPLFGR